jgi:hypothetical protein
MRRHLLLTAVLGIAVMLAGCDAGLPEGNPVESKSVVNPVESAKCEMTADGMLDEGCWNRRAVAMTGFVDGKGSAAPAEADTTVLVTYDKANLLVAVICHEPRTDKIKATVTERDGAIYGEDCVEVYVDPTNARDGSYYGFFVAPNGTVYDRTQDGGWSGEWNSGAKVIDGKAWVAELAIPFKTLGIEPEAGDKIGVMVARNRVCDLVKSQYTTLVPCNNEAKDTSVYPVVQLKD